MAKISKPILKKHNEALEFLKKEKLDFYEREFVFQNYHEGAGKMNNLISAHFTPYPLAGSMTFNVAYENFVDVCAGIGMLSYAMLRYNEYEYEKQKPVGICVENCIEYYEIGKKLLPEFHWINGDVFDLKVIAEIKRLMSGKNFSIISNPPYGKQVKTDTKDLLRYTGADFEYKAIELGAILGAYDGAFLIPENSCPFRYTKRKPGSDVYQDDYKSREYLKFVEQTGLEIVANTGFSTNIEDYESDWCGWRDVSIVTEIAVVEYHEFNYKSKIAFGPPPPPPPPPIINEQFNLFNNEQI